MRAREKEKDILRVKTKDTLQMNARENVRRREEEKTGNFRERVGDIQRLRPK